VAAGTERTLDLGDEGTQVGVGRAGVHLGDEQDPHGDSVGRVIRASYEIEPNGAAAELARIESTGVQAGPESVRAHVVSEEQGRAVLEFPEANWGGDATLLVSALFAGEWADSAAFSRCRLVRVDWPDDLLPGPAFDAAAGVLVGAIVKPSLGLSPAEAARTAAALARGGADLVKDDELLGDPDWCPFEERVRRVVAELPEGVRYAPNVTGPPESLLARAELAAELGTGAVMVNAFAQGLGSLLALRRRELGVPLFAHRVGAALWTRQPCFGVAPAVVAEVTRLCGADYVQVGSFTGSVFDPPEEVRAQIAACHAGQPRSVAVLGGGVGPENAADQVRRSGVDSGLMVLLGSAAYRHPGGVEEGVRATVEALR
jgi:ribulose-bisphosphate carboxylase large chain